jgi:polynucleotide 5'-kinase involved in rRNA processing
MKIGLEEATERLLASPGTVFVLGTMGTGKTRFAIDLLRRAHSQGIPAAFVDADIDQSTVGPPTTVGLKLSAGMEQVDENTLRTADALGFVGTLHPRQHLLPLVTATQKLVARAREAGCRLIVVDTTGFVSGVYGQTLKYHKMDAVAPDFVVALERGGELEPLIGIAQRFTPAEVIELEAPPEEGTVSVEDRISTREELFQSYFSAGTSRWRVKPTVFMPTLPPEFALATLDGLVVGMEDGKGACVGIGVLEYDESEDLLRMVSPVTQGVRGLRLGGVKIGIDGQAKGSVQLSELFGTE